MVLIIFRNTNPSLFERNVCVSSRQDLLVNYACELLGARSRLRSRISVTVGRLNVGVLIVSVSLIMVRYAHDNQGRSKNCVSFSNIQKLSISRVKTNIMSAQSYRQGPI